MKTLFIDIGSSEPLFALTEKGVCVGISRITDPKAETLLMPALETLLASANWEMKDISRIACVVGPGGFMSLRVGVSLANALAWSLKVPLAPVHRSDLIKARAGNKDFIWLHSTKKTALFLRDFRADNERKEATLVLTEELPSVLGKNTAWAGELIPEHRVLVANPEAELRSTEAVLPALLDTLSYQATSLVPWYGRGA